MTAAPGPSSPRRPSTGPVTAPSCSTPTPGGSSPIGEIRVGRQVLNWGESTFIQGGLSVINSVDVSALRVPGAELREAFRPLGMVWTSFDLSQNFSVEAFYEYEWEPIVIDPPGTYFSTNDFAGDQAASTSSWRSATSPIPV